VYVEYTYIQIAAFRKHADLLVVNVVFMV